MMRPGTVIATLDGGNNRRIDNAIIDLERVGTTDPIGVDISNGVVRITGLEQGEYSVEIVAPPYQAWRGRVMLDPTPGDTTRLRLRESALCAP